MTPFAGIAPSFTDIEEPPSATAHRPFGVNHWSSRSPASQELRRRRRLTSASVLMTNLHARDDVRHESNVAIGDAVERPGFDSELLGPFELGRIGDHVREALDHDAPSLLPVRLEAVNLESDHEAR